MYMIIDVFFVCSFLCNHVVVICIIMLCIEYMMHPCFFSLCWTFLCYHAGLCRCHDIMMMGIKGNLKSMWRLSCCKKTFFFVLLFCDIVSNCLKYSTNNLYFVCFLQCTNVLILSYVKTSNIEYITFQFYFIF